MNVAAFPSLQLYLEKKAKEGKYAPADKEKALLAAGLAPNLAAVGLGGEDLYRDIKGLNPAGRSRYGPHLMAAAAVPYSLAILSQARRGVYSKDKEKKAKVLTAKGREQIDEGNFALPGRRYPIHDLAHARNALARVAQHGTPAEQAAVRRAVHAKYPNIGQEKTAMPSKANILKALGFTGLGAAAGGVGGYVAGHRTGMKRDAETPFSSSHMTLAYRKGQHDVINALRQQMQQAGARGKVKKASARGSFDSVMDNFEDDFLRLEKMYKGGKISRPVFEARVKKLDERYERAFDQYSHDLGPGGRRKNALISGGMGGVMGSALGGSFAGRRGALAGGSLGALSLAALSAAGHKRRADRHAARTGQTKKASAIDEILEKLAKKKDKGLTAGGAAKMIGIPAGIGGAMMGLMALRGKAPVGANILRGALGGAAVGTGLTGLIAMGHEIEKADPSGRTLRTVADLAPAVIMAAGAAADLQKKAHVNLKTPDYIMWRRTVIPFPGR